MTNLKNSRLTKKNGQEGPPKALKSRKNRKTNKDFSCYVKRLSTCNIAKARITKLNKFQTQREKRSRR